MKTKLSPKFWCALTLFGLIGQVAWVVENMYLNVFIYKMFRASANDISAMVAASAIAATLTTIFIGAFSDRIGKRKIFICGGYILWGISILGFCLIRVDIIEAIFPATLSAMSLGSSLVIVLDCIMTFFGSSANDAAFNAYLTDSTTSENRGAAEGINAMMPLVAILAVFGGFMAFDLNSPDSWVYIFAIIGACVLSVGILGFFIIDDSATKKADIGYFRGVVHGFLPSTVKKNSSLYLYLFCFIIFNISIQIFMPYLIIYYEVSLGMTDYVFVMAPAIILASAVTALWGKFYDKKGFSLSCSISFIWLMAGYIILYIFTAKLPVFIGSLLMMCGYLSGMAVFGAKIRDLTPVGKAGMFQGVRIFSQVLLPGIIGPAISAEILKDARMITNNDGTTSFVPSEDIFLGALIAALACAILMLIFTKSEKPRLNRSLKTPMEDTSRTSWKEEYPRPQLRRSSYFSLCGEWELSVNKKETLTPLGSIRVPFPPESRLSGIEREMKKGEKYIYKKKFILPDGFVKETTLIHFGAVDQICTLFLNGVKIGSHTGGYLPFSFDISSALVSGENELTLDVTDELDTALAYGKQTKKRGGMWYTKHSGIWQPVWIESLPSNHIKAIRITPTLSSVRIEAEGGERLKKLTLQTADGLKEYSFEGNSIELEIESPVLWTPDNPHLYYFSLSDTHDEISSYFALRTVSIEKRNSKSFICLNGEPIFCHGLLDQGYFPDGIYLPASPDGYEIDILTAKKLGFNMLRKHIKIEPDIFYYYCDKLGMLVFQDMVNSGKYSFLIDTALPTLGIKKGITHKASQRRRKSFEGDARKTLSLLYSHPCVVYYTVFNEGWGQYDADRIYRELKALDPTRVFDATSGWFAENESDVVSEHIYFKPVKLKPCADRPLVLSEFGGYSCKIPEHSFNLDKTYGYRFFEKQSDFIASLEKLYSNEIIPAIKDGLCATVLTQLSDVEDETNGLMTYDRQMIKADEETMQSIASSINREFQKAVR